MHCCGVTKFLGSIRVDLLFQKEPGPNLTILSMLPWERLLLNHLWSYRTKFYCGFQQKLFPLCHHSINHTLAFSPRLEGSPCPHNKNLPGPTANRGFKQLKNLAKLSITYSPCLSHQAQAPDNQPTHLAASYLTNTALQTQLLVYFPWSGQ